MLRPRIASVRGGLVLAEALRIRRRRGLGLWVVGAGSCLVGKNTTVGGPPVRILAGLIRRLFTRFACGYESAANAGMGAGQVELTVERVLSRSESVYWNAMR